MDGAEFREGRPNKEESRTNMFFRLFRSYFQLPLHRTDAVEAKLLELSDFASIIQPALKIHPSSPEYIPRITTRNTIIYHASGYSRYT